MRISTKIHFKSFLISLIFVGYVLQIALQGKFPILSNYDEVGSVLAICYLTYLFINNKLSKSSRNGIIIMVLVTVIGLGGNLYWGVQTNGGAIVTDVGNMFKVYISFFASYEFFKTNKNNIRVQNYLNLYSKFFVLPGFILAIVNLFVDIGMYTEYTYGLRAFNFILNRVGNLNVVCLACLIVLTAQLNLVDEKQRKKQIMYIVMALVLDVSTLRTRAFAFVIVYIAGYVYFVRRKKVNIEWRYIIPVIAVIIYIAYPKLQYYFIDNSNTARSVLFRYGFQTASTYWPLGAGFGSYGTFAAKKYWSPLYNQYNFNQYYGLKRENALFLTDNYWPAIAGEFGYIGLIFVAILLISIYSLIIKETTNRNIIRFVALFGIVCLTIASTVSSSFFNFSNIMNVSLIGFELSNFSHNQLRTKKDK